MIKVSVSAGLVPIAIMGSFSQTFNFKLSLLNLLKIVMLSLLVDCPVQILGNFLGTSRQPRMLIFGMQPYFIQQERRPKKK